MLCGVCVVRVASKPVALWRTLRAGRALPVLKLWGKQVLTPSMRHAPRALKLQPEPLRLARLMRKLWHARDCDPKVGLRGFRAAEKLTGGLGTPLKHAGAPITTHPDADAGNRVVGRISMVVGTVLIGLVGARAPSVTPVPYT